MRTPLVGAANGANPSFRAPGMERSSHKAEADLEPVTAAATDMTRLAALAKSLA
jgi:hypothetical protein